MTDLTYKGITLAEQAVPSEVRGFQFWYGEEGRVLISLGLNTDSGVYSAMPRVVRPAPGGGDLRLPAGVAEGTDWVATVGTACAAFVVRADKPEAQKKPRELDIRPVDRAAVVSIIERTEPLAARVR